MVSYETTLGRDSIFKQLCVPQVSTSMFESVAIGGVQKSVSVFQKPED